MFTEYRALSVFIVQAVILTSWNIFEGDKYVTKVFMSKEIRSSSNWLL